MAARSRWLLLTIAVLLVAGVLGIDVATEQSAGSTAYQVVLTLVIYGALVFGPMLSCLFHRDR